MTAGPVFCGFYGRDNLGDEAILGGLVDLWSAVRPHEKPLVISGNPQGTRTLHGVGAVPSRRLSFRNPRHHLQLGRSILRRSHFVLGGGDLLRDSPTQDVVGPWLAQLELAQHLRRRTAVIGISVGDLWRPESIRRIRSTLARTDFIAVRDQASKMTLMNLDVNVACDVTPDLALRLFPRRVERQSSPEKRIIVCLRGLADRGDEGAAVEHQRQVIELASALDELVRQGYVVELVPFRSVSDRFQPVDDDYVASLQLAHLATKGHSFIVHRHVADLVGLREVLSGADVIMGMRLHSVIMAVGLGVPVVALSYDQKVENFCQEVGLPEVLSGAEISSERLLGAVSRAVSGSSLEISPRSADYLSRASVLEELVGDW